MQGPRGLRKSYADPLDGSVRLGTAGGVDRSTSSGRDMVR